MPRKPRLHFPNATYHVIIRGNDGTDIFFSDQDRTKFYSLLREAIEGFNFRLHAFCLMTNHAHFVLQVGKIPLSRILQNISQRYTQWINSTHSRTGHVFQGRYKAILIDADEYLLQLVRYVHRNPIRAHIVDDLGKYWWSSHCVYLGRENLSWVTTDFVLSQFASQEITARARYLDFVADHIDDGRRKEFYSGMCDGRILGDDDFTDNAILTARQEPPDHFTLADVLAAVCCEFGISEAELRSAGKAHPASEARAVAALIVEESRHMSLTALAKELQRDASALGKLAQRLRHRTVTDAQLAESIDGVRAKLHKCPDV
ncbi:transposase, Y1_Tnp domain-containing [Citrifermentans bemidjiense Bem]|uniref:Transposase, Y1_Tnp domain-containing n=1 Tax=Citrifermentans bemidjiense (strain ATCC BAA-1014 / DSM 16622 / JCM 12645 / Bem) TaxID=404380 RepID=B5EE58_CITBB|nr:transposase [Citrifermentans bemidjiense]ACH37796.1 transposase, Y1_Tnp domain-containing [Citrifermentans bemidjiense Bem]